MKDEIIMITGGAGYIGSHLVKLLMEKKKKVFVLDDLSAGHREVIDILKKILGRKNLVFECVSLLDEERLKKTLKKITGKYRVSGIIDFAARIAIGESQQKPYDYFRTNVVGFRNLLLATGDIPLVKSSTAATYGSPPQEDIPLKESLLPKIVKEARFAKSQLLPAAVPFETLIEWYEKEVSGPYPFFRLTTEDKGYLFIPVNVYGVTKMMCEIMLKKYEKETGRRYVALRYFNAAGADKSGLIGEDHVPETHLVPLVLKAALGKIASIKIFGEDYPTPDGTCIRDYISVLDLAEAHVIALEHIAKGGASRTFNLGTNKGYTVKQIIDISKKVTGREIPVEITGRREGDSPVLVADASLIKKEMGWNSRFGIEEIISSAWIWHSTHPHGYGAGL